MSSDGRPEVNELRFDGEYPVRRSNLHLLEGFVREPNSLSVRDFKRIACSLRIRLAVSGEASAHPALDDIASDLGISVRTIYNYFPVREAMFAFPPPEMAVGIVESTEGVTELEKVPDAVLPLLEALQTNTEGRTLMTNLVYQHEAHPELRASDAYFATELRKCLEVRDGMSHPAQVVLVGFFTEALRLGLEQWARHPDSSTLVIHRCLRDLLAARPPRTVDEGVV